MEGKPVQKHPPRDGAPAFNNREDDPESQQPEVAAPPSASSNALTKRGYELPEPSPHEVTMGAAVGTAAPSPRAAAPVGLKKQRQQKQQQNEQQQQLAAATSNDPPLKRQKVSSEQDHHATTVSKSSSSGKSSQSAAVPTPRPSVRTTAAATSAARFAAMTAGAGGETPPVKTPDTTAMESFTSNRQQAEETAAAAAASGPMENEDDDDHEVVMLTMQQRAAQHESVVQHEGGQEEHDNEPRSHVRTASVASDLSSSSASTLANNSYQPYHEQQQDERHEQQLSPVPTAYVPSEIPPAPPSTPASSAGSAFAWDSSAAAASGASIFMGSATPLPIRASVQNASQLEQEQMRNRMLMMMDDEEGAATPMPPRPEAFSYQDAASTAGATSSQPPPSGGKTPTASTTSGSSRRSGTMPTLPEDFSDWAVGDRYEMVRILGRGSYGEVAQAIDLSKTAVEAAHGGENNETANAIQTTTTTTTSTTPAFVAIKRIQSPFDQEVDAIRLYREVHILRQMRGHDCIIQLLDVVQPPTDDLDDFHDLYLVFEYVDTDLYKLIMSPQYLTTEHIQTFLYQMLAGLKYIHSFSVIHRDLKPANILLNEDCSLKICDFGLARIVDSTTMSAQQEEERGPLRRPTTFAAPPMGLTRQLTRHVVTRWYRAPELILIQPYTSAVDIWSLGCILAELLSMQEGNVACYQDRKPLFPGGTCFPLSGDREMKKDDKLDQLSVIFGIIGTPSPQDVAAIGKANEYIASLGKMEGKPLESIFPAADPAAIDLLRQMLLFNPKRRCTAAQALDHAFFKTVRRHELEKTAAPGPLIGPDFLETNSVDLKVLKQKTYEEVLWYRDHGGGGGRTTETSPAATAAHDSKASAATNAAP